MKNKAVGICILAIAGCFLFCGISCISRGIWFEAFWQGFACSVFVSAGVKELQK